MNQEQINYFFSRTSFAGLISLYALKLSLDKQIAFDRNDFAKHIEIASSDYLFGFIVACSAFQILNYNTKNFIITVTDIEPEFYNRIESEVSKMSSKQEHWPKIVENVFNYFK